MSPSEQAAARDWNPEERVSPSEQVPGQPSSHRLNRRPSPGEQLAPEGKPAQPLEARRIHVQRRRGAELTEEVE